MKPFLFFTTLFLFSFNRLAAADNYQIGDHLYVWAKRGLNVRKGPGTKFKIIKTVSFGKKIKVEAITDQSFNVTGITAFEIGYKGKEVGPIIFKGKWVKIRTESGEIGFVIDQYLLRFEPFKKTPGSANILNLETIARDTTHHQDVENINELYFTETSSYKHRISKIESGGNYLGEVSYSFPNCSIEEVLVLFSASWNNYEHCKVYKNWKEEIILIGEEEICTTHITYKNNTVFVAMECSC